MTPSAGHGRRPRSCPTRGATVPIVASVAEAVKLGANVLVIGVAPFGGALTRRVARRRCWRRSTPGCTSRPGCTRCSSEDPELSAAAAAAGVELRDLRAAPPGLSVPAGRAAGRARRPHRRLGLRDRQDVGDAGARRGGPRARAGVGVRGHRADRDRDHRLGDRRRPRDLGLHLGRGRRGWSHEGAARAPLLFVEGQGALGHPAYSGRDARAAARLPARRARALPPRGRRRTSTTTRRRRSRRCRELIAIYEGADRLGAGRRGAARSR